jgi:transcriptional regulator with XRE-family HTH domain
MAFVLTRNQGQAHDLLIRTLRESRLTQKELAQLTGVDEATVSRVLSRPRNIEINTLGKLLYGLCGAMLHFRPYYPDKQSGRKTYLSLKIDDFHVTESRQFFDMKTGAGKSTTQGKVMLSNMDAAFDRIVSTDTGAATVLEHSHAGD